MKTLVGKYKSNNFESVAFARTRSHLHAGIRPRLGEEHQEAKVGMETEGISCLMVRTLDRK